jgi:hypothetical protein
MIGSHDAGDGITDYVFLGFGVFFFGIIIFIAGNAILDLTSGMKTIYTGIVTDKENHRARSKKGSNQPKHCLHFGEKKLYVTARHFGEVNVSDEVYSFHGKYSNWLIGLHTGKQGTMSLND